MRAWQLRIVKYMSFEEAELAAVQALSEDAALEVDVYEANDFYHDEGTDGIISLMKVFDEPKVLSKARDTMSFELSRRLNDECIMANQNKQHTKTTNSKHYKHINKQ